MGKRTCSIDGCGRPRHAKGYCPGHYMQAKEGRPFAPLIGKALTARERFEARIDRTPDTGCHHWTGALNSDGYGQTSIGKKQLKAHRVAFEMENGAIPDGMLVDHSCHNRQCVNPKHLRIVDKSGNAQNRKSATTGSASGVRGVYWASRQRSWVVSVTVRGARHQVGYFRDLSEAEYAAVTARAHLHGVHSTSDLVYLAERGLSVSDFKNDAETSTS